MHKCKVVKINLHCLSIWSVIKKMTNYSWRKGEIQVFLKYTVATIIGPLYSILFATSVFQDNSSWASPIMPDEVRDRRPFFNAESFKVSQMRGQCRCFSSSVHPNHFLNGSGQGTRVTMAEPTFCSHTFFMFVLDHCPDGRANYGPL